MFVGTDIGFLTFYFLVFRYDTLCFWLYADPKALNSRLDERVDDMLEVCSSRTYSQSVGLLNDKVGLARSPERDHRNARHSSQVSHHDIVVIRTSTRRRSFTLRDNNGIRERLYTRDISIYRYI